MGFPDGSAVKNPPAFGRPSFNPWIGKIPWRRKWQPAPVLLPGNPVDREVWRATVHKVAKSWTQPSTHAGTETQIDGESK